MEPNQVALSAYQADLTESLVGVSYSGRRLAVIPVPVGESAQYTVSDQRTLWLWAGSLLWTWTCPPDGGVLSCRDVGDDILAALPRGDSTIIVAETGVWAVSSDLRQVQLLHDHHDVIIRFERRGNSLIFWDFSGASTELPGLFS